MKSFELARMAIEALPTADRRRLLESMNTAGPPECLLRRKETARRLGVTQRAVDRLAAAGYLPRVRLPGRVRAVGFRESDVSAIIEGAAAQ